MLLFVCLFVLCWFVCLFIYFVFEIPLRKMTLNRKLYLSKYLKNNKNKQKTKQTQNMFACFLFLFFSFFSFHFLFWNSSHVRWFQIGKLFIIFHIKNKKHKNTAKQTKGTIKQNRNQTQKLNKHQRNTCKKKRSKYVSIRTIKILLY